MKYKQFHKLIEEDNAEQKQALYEGLKQDLNLPDAPAPAEKPASKWRNFIKKPYRLIACLSTAVAVSLAIILPITLNRAPQPTSEERYCSVSDCAPIRIDHTLKEYFELNNLPILYMDWYDIAEEGIGTELWVNKDDYSDIIYYKEEITSIKGFYAHLIIIDSNIHVDRFETAFNNLRELYETNIASVQVYWSSGASMESAVFEYNGYRYFLDLNDGGWGNWYEGYILEMIESMIIPKTE